MTLLSKDWGQSASQVLHEVEKKRKLDKVERYEFLVLFRHNVEKLMAERGYLEWRITHDQTPQGTEETHLPIPKCSASDFVNRLKTKDPKAYKRLIAQSLNPDAYSQKGHQYLVEQTKLKLERHGYEVHGGRSKKAIERLRELNQGQLVGICQGRDRNPDLIAFKNNEPLIVEAASRKTRVVRQLDYDQMAGNTVLVLPIPTGNLKVWGLSELYEEQHQNLK